MSVDIQKVVDHAARALSRLAVQYKSAPLLAKVLGVFTSQVQDIENAVYDTLVGMRLENAVGAQLDVLGRVVGQDRESANDAEYRLRIAARRAANNSIGSAESVYRVFDILLPTHTLAMEPQYPAAFVLNIVEAVDAALVSMYRIFMQDTKAAGVNGQGIYALVAPSNQLILSSVADFGVDGANKGLGDVAMTSGGRLAGVI